MVYFPPFHVFAIWWVDQRGTAIMVLVGSKKNRSKVSNEQNSEALPAPADLIELEERLASEDRDKTNLQNYSPEIQVPPVCWGAKYEQELPKLFRKRATTRQKQINIEDMPSITQLGPIPAYELLKVVSQESPPNFPFPPLNNPSTIPPPPSWTPWTLSEARCDIGFPIFEGPLAPLNFFVRLFYKRAISRSSWLKAWQVRANNEASARNKELSSQHENALQRYLKIKQEQEKAWEEAQRKNSENRAEFFASYDEEKRCIDTLVETAGSPTPEGLIARIEQTLKIEEFPSFMPPNFEIRLDEKAKILILEHEFPDIGALSWMKNASTTKRFVLKNANQREVKESANLLYPAISLRLACEVARLDLHDLIEAVVVNGWADYIEKTTGQQKRAYCCSLFASKAQILHLNLGAADPVAAFSALKGVAAKTLELTPIAPILRLNTEDKRFVDPKEVLETMSAGQNIATMEWEDFEHLCRELFEKAFAASGAEVKVTQASRDQGVDAVIFDPDVLRGGKIVVQAKRYTNAVDVAAVRELYGATINEGATKGILVTTSYFGPDAYAFAKDKPITLINGSELLGLLKTYGYSFRIDLAAAKRFNAEAASRQNAP